MNVVFGLGNPGLPYALTRHNVGFEVIDLYRKVHRWREKGRIHNSALIYRRGGLLLVKPMTFMNESGVAVSGVLRRYGIPMERALVVYDDLDLPLGRLRLLRAGGPGSHNGMRSVLAALRSEEIPRLRIGIGIEDRRSRGRDYVLERFTPDERVRVLPALESAVEAIDVFRRDGIDAAMTRFNRR